MISISWSQPSCVEKLKVALAGVRQPFIILTRICYLLTKTKWSLSSKSINCRSFILITGEEESLLKLMRNGSALQEVDSQGWLPLHEAAVQPNKTILEITLKGNVPLRTMCQFHILTYEFKQSSLFQLHILLSGNRPAWKEKLLCFWLWTNVLWKMSMFC